MLGKIESKQRNVVALIPGMVTYSFRTTNGIFAVLFNLDAHTFAIITTEGIILVKETVLPLGTQKKEAFNFEFAQRLLQAYFDQ